MNTTRILAVALATGLALAASPSQAALTLAQQGTSDTWEVRFDPITLTANSNTGQFDWLVFEDFFDADSTIQGIPVGGSSTLAYSVDGGATVTVSPVFKNGTFNQTLGGIDANDLFVNLAGVGPDPAAGSRVTISGSFQFTSSDVPAFSAASVDAAFWDNGGGGTIQSAEVPVTVGDPPKPPPSLNINFGLVLNDSNAVDADESSLIGLTGSQAASGSGWNNVLLRTTGTGAPDQFTAATQGGNHLDLVDSSGTDAGVDLTSTGAFFSNFGNVSSPNASATGDGGLFNSYLLLSAGESVSLAGLSTWAPNGYRVHAFFDIGPFTRTYGITMHDGGSPQSFWTADSAGTDADPDNDGAINWTGTTATTEATAVEDANHALYGPFTGDTLTISGAGSEGRATLSGIQILPITEPLATINSFTVTPDTFTAGETVTLSWDVSDADNVSIDQGLGSVNASGSQPLTPGATTTWTLTAVRGTAEVTAQATATLGRGTIDVYLLSGQSNMQGTARASKLPAGLLSMPEIRLYAAGSGVNGGIANRWVDLQPSGGGSFGPEIGIGERLRDLCPGQPIALIKYAASGNSLEINFRPGANATDTANWGASFTAMVNTFNNGLAKLRADGWQPVIKGMCWQQGEQDAKDGLNVPESNTSADDYGANLAHFIGRIREQFAAYAGPDGIRFAPGQVLPYAPRGGDVQARFPGRDLVRQAILDVDEDSGTPLAVPNTRSVPTNEIDHPSHAQEVDGYRDSDEVHQNATALLAIGRSMAYAMMDLDPQSYLDWSSSFSLTGGPDDDDDGDGLSNRAEYMLGGDPTDSGDTPRPAFGMANDNGDTIPTYTLTHNLEASDVTPDIQFSADLIDWTSNTPVFVSSIKQADRTAILTFHGPWPIDDPARPRGFFRTVEE